MAQYYDGYCIVQWGDTLSEIASHWGTTYQSLASYNHISNPNLIYVGQRINRNNGPNPPAPAPTSTSSKMVTIQHFGIQVGTDRTAFVTWTWDKYSTTENYKVDWYYTTSDGVRYIGGNHTVAWVSDVVVSDTYSAPENAASVQVYIKPISKTHKVNNQETAYWTADWTTKKNIILVIIHLLNRLFRQLKSPIINLRLRWTIFLEQLRISNLRLQKMT